MSNTLRLTALFMPLQLFWQGCKPVLRRHPTLAACRLKIDDRGQWRISIPMLSNCDDTGWVRVSAIESVTWTWLSAVRIEITGQATSHPVAGSLPSTAWLLSLRAGRSDSLLRRHLAALPVANGTPESGVPA